MSNRAGAHRDVRGLNMSEVLAPFVDLNRRSISHSGRTRLRAVTMPAVLPQGAKVEDTA
jgi:hypothetical protein